MPSIEETIEFIKRAHADQKDKAGDDYYHHPVAVMGHLPPGVSDDVRLAALLHDIIEDTPYSRIDLARMGYSDATLDIVELVTKHSANTQPYSAKVRAIIDSGNEGAILIKFADMKENTRPDRLKKLEPELAARLQEKYRLPMLMLTEAVKALGYDVTQGNIPSRHL